MHRCVKIRPVCVSSFCGLSHYITRVSLLLSVVRLNCSNFLRYGVLTTYTTLNIFTRCSTLSDMKAAVTIRLDADLEKLLDLLCRQTGRTRSDLVRDALRRQLSLLRFERLRRKTLPFAEARGYLTDEDIVRDVS